MCDPSDVEFCVEAMYAEERGLFEDLERKGGKVLMMRVEEEGQISRAVSERPDLEEAYRAAYVKYNANPRSKGLVGWTLFMWPSGQEAEHEGMSHKDYFDFVVKACDQEWGKIWKAQELLKLKLDGAKVIKFVADGTDVEVGIEGFTFLNSTVDTNAPGAELYTAPEIGKVNGNIFAKGKRQYQGHVMEDITLRIEKGRVVEASARVGDEHLQKILDSDEGSRYFGEVAIGGNPGIMKRLMSIMYSEKMGASFHMALGDAYSDKNGVKLDNGNRSVVHWDLVISMRPEDGGGQVWVDGELIQEDGIYLDPRLSALNRRDPEDEA